MAKRSYEERIAALQKKQEQINAEVRELKQRQSVENRKKRTRRLIELGGIVESVLGRETNEEDKARFLNYLKSQEKRGNYFTKAMNTNTSNAGVGKSEDATV